MKSTLERLADVRVLVVGDLMLDRYQWGDVDRISPEAPVPVVKVRKEETRLGGAANVVHNLIALGCHVGVCGMVGEDSPANILLERMTGLGADVQGVIPHPDRPTSVKVRVMARNQQLLRTDWEDATPLDERMEGRLIAWLGKNLTGYDGVIVSDYGKGLLTPKLLSALIGECRNTGKKLVVDPKGSDYTRYRGATCLTPNELEAAAVAGRSLEEQSAALDAAIELRTQLQTDHLCITLGAEGVLALQDAGNHRFFPARARDVYDVTGAGDTFISLFGALLISGAGFFEAVETANLAAGIVVGKLGTATVTPAELLGFADGKRKIYGTEEIGPLAESLREQGSRIAFTNGCFDLLHAGHIQYLQASRQHGDILIVGLNSDDSVRRLKGEGRPLIGEEDRAHLLSALACVDYVVIFGEDTPESLIRSIRPEVLTKGADYKVEEVVGHDLVPQWGGKVELIPLKEHRSTSGLIDRIVSGNKG